jgi:prepilin-type N-terminal cleavage/methylation domain-containing protein
MKKRTDKYGLTLIEMLIVVGIIALLTAIIVGVARRIDNQSKERLTENTIAIVNTALGQFKDYGYDYNDLDYRNFAFPLDCNGFNAGQSRDTLSDALDAVNVVMTPTEPNINFSGSEVLYLLLSKIPASRATLEKIDRSLVKPNGSVTIAGETSPLIRIVDPWGTTLRYDYCNEEPPLPGETAKARTDRIGRMWDSRRTFPVVISAGPDRIFGTSDDIRSK